MSEIAFLGLGAMGSRMARRLVDAGHSVRVWNRTPAAADELVRAGAATAATPREAARDAELVITMVADDSAARSVWLDPENGAARGLRPGALAIESSTVTIHWIRELGRSVAAGGAELIDAPVAGSRPQAEAGQLIYIVGGDASAVERARPTLAPLYSAYHHVGALGQGATLKLAVNAFFAAQLSAIAELLGFLSKSGFEEKAVVETLAAFPTMAPGLAGAARLMANRRIAPMFTIDLMKKDLGYALEAGAEAGAALPMIDAAAAVFARASAQGQGAANISAVRLSYE